MREEQSTALRRLLTQGKTLVKPGAYNALSAMIIEKAGFPCCGVTGYGVSRVAARQARRRADHARRNRDDHALHRPRRENPGDCRRRHRLRQCHQRHAHGRGLHHRRRCRHPHRGPGRAQALRPCRRQADRPDGGNGRQAARGRPRAARARSGLRADRALRCARRGGRQRRRTDPPRQRLPRRGRRHDFPRGADLGGRARTLRAKRSRARCTSTAPASRPGCRLRGSNELGIAMVSNATGSLRTSTVAMWRLLRRSSQRTTSKPSNASKPRTKDHPAGNMHAFIGFYEIKKLEEEFLPGAEVLAKYEGSVGFQP